MFAFGPLAILLAVLVVTVIVVCVGAASSMSRIRLGHPTLNCPQCGELTTLRHRRCEHCGAEIGH
jgi:predicted RNA-binding Zn-ribbon protein involved in translation (DUF1610 family)